VTGSGSSDVNPSPRLAEVADRVFAYLQPDGGWCVNNAGIIAPPGGTVVIDTAATEARARALRASIGSVSTTKAQVLVNTHHHGDHTFGNFVFSGEAVIIAHELARTEMAEKGLSLTHLWPQTRWGELELVLPSVVFDDRLVLHAGDRRVELIHVGPAHTTNDVVAWLPEERVLFAGDVVLAGCTPFVLMGSLAGSLRALERLRALDPEVVVPGHGPVCGPEIFDANHAYLTWLDGIAKSGSAGGVGPLEAARSCDLGAFADLLDPERVVANLHRAYHELAHGPDWAYVPSGPAFADMVAYNGGVPLTCRA
jgi:cyclase